MKKVGLRKSIQRIWDFLALLYRTVFQIRDILIRIRIRTLEFADPDPSVCGRGFQDARK